MRVGSRGESRSQSWLRDHSQPPASSLGDGGHGTTLSGRLPGHVARAPPPEGAWLRWWAPAGPLTRRRPRVTWGAGRGLGQRPEPWSAPRQPAPAGPSHGRRGLLPGAVRAAGAVREGEPGQLRVLRRGQQAGERAVPAAGPRARTLTVALPAVRARI